MDLLITTIRSRPRKSDPQAEGGDAPWTGIVSSFLQTATVFEFETETRKDVIIRESKDLQALMDEVAEGGTKSVINIIPLSAPPLPPGTRRIVLAFFHTRLDEDTSKFSWRAGYADQDIDREDIARLALATEPGDARPALLGAVDLPITA